MANTLPPPPRVFPRFSPLSTYRAQITHFTRFERSCRGSLAQSTKENIGRRSSGYYSVRSSLILVFFVFTIFGTELFVILIRYSGAQ